MTDQPLKPRQAEDIASPLKERIDQITGQCSCHEAYKSRDLIAPDCVFHDCALEIEDFYNETRRTPDPEFCELVAEVMAACVELAVEIGPVIGDPRAASILNALAALRSGDKAALERLMKEMGK